MTVVTLASRRAAPISSTMGTPAHQPATCTWQPAMPCAQRCITSQGQTLTRSNGPVLPRAHTVD